MKNKNDFWERLEKESGINYTGVAANEYGTRWVKSPCDKKKKTKIDNLFKNITNQNK